MTGCEGGSCSTCGSGSCSSDDPDRLPPGMLKHYDINQSTADGTLVFIELDAGGIVSPVSAEILAAAKSMTEGRLFAVVFGGSEIKSLYPEIFGYRVDTLYHVRDKNLETFMPEACASCMAEIASRIEPAVILFGATAIGREVAPRLAAILQSGLTADCTGLRMEGRKLISTRPAFGGTLMADIECIGFPQMATVRPGAFPTPLKKSGQGTAIYWQPKGGCLKEIISDEVPDDEDEDIRDARILIALGNGIRDRSLIDIAESVARKMGASVCCSRALVEKGWMPSSRQVGLSGRIVEPELYIAFGISGAVQHRVGMNRAGRIIAVNSDPSAPIHGFSDLSLFADVAGVLRSLDSSLRSLGAGYGG